MSGVDEVFLEVFGHLPRAGPGDEASSLRALDVVRRTLEPGRVLDAGCGPGVQTLALARALPRAQVLAVDLLPLMVRRTRAAIEAAGLTPRVQVEQRDMLDPGLAPGSTDLVWCEGAAYAVGVQRALEAWRPLLSEAGHVALTELVWSGEPRPAEARAFLEAEYPALTDVPGTIARAEAAGYRVLETFLLPEAAWWAPYYTPLEARLAELRPSLAGDDAALAVLDAAAREVELFRRHARAYGYAFFVARPT